MHRMCAETKYVRRDPSIIPKYAQLEDIESSAPGEANESARHPSAALLHGKEVEDGPARGLSFGLPDLDWKSFDFG
jgi:hypothetical protein